MADFTSGHDQNHRVTLTVVLSNYNHAKFIAQAFEAILAQTHQPDEFIIIDDASTDNSVEIIESFLPRFANAAFLRNARNRGVINNMNRALADSHGSLIYFAAADDITYPEFFRKGADLLAAHEQAALFSARSDIIGVEGENHGPLPTPIPLYTAGFISPQQAARELMWDDSWIMGNTTIYRRMPLLEAGGFPIELGSFTDGFVGRLLALRHGACFTPEVLCAWRRMEGGYAWSQAIDRARTTQIVAAVRAKMDMTQDVFPPGYFDRWKGRHLFGAERFALQQQKHSALQRGWLAYLKAALFELIMTGWLFLRLRPRDLGPVISRRLKYAIKGLVPLK